MTKFHKKTLAFVLVFSIMLSMFSMGFSFSASALTADDIKSFEIQPITIIEGTNGYTTSGYDSETGQYVKYYRYSLYNFTYNIEFDDGTVRSGSNSGFSYNSEWYSFDFRSEQSYENQWLPGNTYTAQVSVLGKTVDVSVEIINTPIKSLEISPKTIVEGTNGYTASGYDSEKHEYIDYYYYWESNICTYKEYLPYLILSQYWGFF